MTWDFLSDLLKIKGLSWSSGSFLHVRNPDMISGEELHPPEPPSAQRGLISGLSRAAGRERSDHRGQLFLPQKPLLGAAGDVAPDSGASITPLPRGCGRPPDSGGNQKSGGQRAFWGSLQLVQPSLCPGPPTAPSTTLSLFVAHALPCKADGTSVSTRPPTLAEAGRPAPRGRASLQGE